MSGVGPYFSWKVHVLNLLLVASHRTDKSGPILTSVEIKEMEARYTMGDSPAEFVEWLRKRDESLQRVG